MDTSDESSNQLHHSPHETLTGQVLDTQNLEQLLPHPFNLSFPTLNDDGSIPDLTAHQSRHHQYPPTPPAALSSLGARAKMDAKDTTSEDSFADSQYDMMDDLSEISNDDHDTASIASHDGTSGQLTPEYAQSEADGHEEETELPENTQTATAFPSAESFVTLPSVASSSSPKRGLGQSKNQMKAENDLIDSYTSEDLETPRQSTMTNVFASTYRSSRRKSAERVSKSASSMNHILFISDRDMPTEDMDVICTRAAWSMDTSGPTPKSEYKVFRQPATPSGIQEASATVMRDRENACATIQHCIGAERREAKSYKLLVLDSDVEHSSYFTIGEDAKIDLQTPNLAIFYLDTFTHGMAWFDTAYSAVQSLKVPALIIRDSDLPAEKQATFEQGKADSQLVFDAKEYMAMNRAKLATVMSQLTGISSPTPSSLPPSRSSRISILKASLKQKWAGSSTYFKFGLMLLVCTLSLLFNATATQYFSTADPGANLAARREALTLALDNLSASVNITKAIDIEHLMPAPPSNCTQGLLAANPCPVQAHAQDVPPNQVIISLQNGPREPRLNSLTAHRSDGRAVSFNQTKLMPGVYHLALDPSEAYGKVDFSIITDRPAINVSWSNNFGSRLLQRKTYQKASTDLSKIVGKDVAVMRHAAQGITEKMTTEIGAGLSATKNVTSQLALYVTRDIQLAADTAVSIFSKAAQASNRTATTLTKDLVLVQKGVSETGGNLFKSFKSTMESVQANSQALIRAPLEMSKYRLALASERLQALQKALQRSSDKMPIMTKKSKKSSLLEKFENSLAATPEHELSGKQKRKQSRQDKALREEVTRKSNAILERAKKQREVKMAKAGKPRDVFGN